jgi:hypothetical protein
MKTFSVKNFEKFQHYKDRAPPWIKLYNGLLEDYEFGGLPDASKMHLIAIWLLASRSDNKIPYDPKWVSNRINATEPVDLALLAKRGFIVLDQGEEQYGSEMLAECLTREEGETEERKSKAEPRSPSAPGVSEDFENLKKVYPRRKGNYGWKAAERKFNSLVKTGVDPKAIIASARRLGETLSARVGTEYIPMPASVSAELRRRFNRGGQPRPTRCLGCLRPTGQRQNLSPQQKGRLALPVEMAPWIRGQSSCWS